MTANRKLKIKKTVVLIGLMGAGKTTAGKMLSEKLGLDFIDTDAVIEKKQGRSISLIFEQEGEVWFRSLEKKIITEILEKSVPCVMATGGGAYIEEETRKIIKQHAVAVWLKADPEILYKRIENDNTRPLLKKENKKNTLKQLAEKRYPIYAKADIVIDTGHISCEAIAEEIIKKL